MDTQTDEMLVSAVCKGDIVSFETLVKRYEKKLLSYVFTIVGNHHAAQEIVQDAFFSIYRNIANIKTDKKFSSYLYSATKNHAISFLRRRKQTLPLLEHHAVDETSLYDEMIQQEQTELIKDALSKVDTKYQSVLRLFYIDELSYRQMSEKLKLPINTVRTYLRRGKSALGHYLREKKHI